MEGGRWREDLLQGERRASLQPRLHAYLLDPASGVGEPRRELCEVHARVVGKILLLRLRGVWVGLVVFDPLD